MNIPKKIEKLIDQRCRYAEMVEKIDYHGLRKIKSMWTSRMYLEDVKFIIIRLVLQIESVRRF